MMADHPTDNPKATIDPTDPAEPNSSREDAETTAARRNLKQTSISGTGGASPDKSGTDEDEAAASDRSGERGPTPDDSSTEAQQNKPDDKVSSPKKKRARDELDEPKDDAFVLEESTESKPANGNAALNRTDHSEPQKKRPRDESGTESDAEPKDAVIPAQHAKSDKEKPDHDSPAVSDAKDKTEERPQSSNAAFLKSGFAKLSGQTSGFGALGNSTKSSVFGGSSVTAASPFATQGAAKAPSAAPTEPAKLVFGNKGGSASPFAAAGLNGAAKCSPFSSTYVGGGFGNASTVSGFGSALSRLGGLADQAKAGGAPKTEKPARPFGAPDSDDEQNSEDGDDEAEDENGEKDVEQEREKTKDPAAEDAKKPKLQRVAVDDGESNEATVLAVRAKMYQMDKVEGWKERGAGMLKLNVPKASLEFDESGNADMHTFDASALESKVGAGGVRLVMRQDHTLSLILNTTVVPAIQFKLLPKLKAAHVLFTAFEANEVKQVQMKMSEANAKLFMEQVKFIQKVLADV